MMVILFLSFEKVFLETLLKIRYQIVAIYIAFSLFAIIDSNFLVYLIARLVYDFSLILLVICRNTTEISKSLKKKLKFF